MSNTSTINKKYSVWSFVNKTNSKKLLCYQEHPEFTCICMDDANKVAIGTNGLYMMVNPDEYQPDKYINAAANEKRIITKNGEAMLNYKYPNYKSIIPSEQERIYLQFDAETIYNINKSIANAKYFLDVYNKNNKPKLYKKNIWIYLSNIDRIMQLDVLLKMMEYSLDDDGWFTTATYHNIFKYIDNKLIAFTTNEISISNESILFKFGFCVKSMYYNINIEEYMK